MAKQGGHDGKKGEHMGKGGMSKKEAGFGAKLKQNMGKHNTMQGPCKY